MGDFDQLLSELSRTRGELETYRYMGGHFGQRAELMSRLAALRYEIARARNEL